MNFRAITEIELIQHIADLAIDVAPRGKGRTKDQCEQWQIHHMLLGFNKAGLLSLPLELKKRERPDFFVQNGLVSQGIELTEIINQDYARAISLPEAKGEQSVVDPALFKWGQTGRSLDELRVIAKRQKLIGPAWMGNRVEIDFARSVVDTVESKHKKFAAGFTKYDENILLAYHNNSTPILDFGEACSLTHEALSGYWCKNGFDKVIVQKYQTLLLFSKGKFSIFDIES
ncbi:hypothetical protein WH43_04345 [Rheinheimera sp. KL1]|uniref:hypothetical protein n=1 Tax=Rheinheimera sp. KL1 TaxID=1635005 RepID=UPI0006A95D83|nr:hypothetical protein [Rheinheimera sp. KL1]KOO59219.1 hypothetical protein WH43_04345 [Rheinheimera sp. KL1]